MQRKPGCLGSLGYLRASVWQTIRNNKCEKPGPQDQRVNNTQSVVQQRGTKIPGQTSTTGTFEEFANQNWQHCCNNQEKSNRIYKCYPSPRHWDLQPGLCYELLVKLLWISKGTKSLHPKQNHLVLHKSIQIKHERVCQLWQMPTNRNHWTYFSWLWGLCRVYLRAIQRLITALQE